METKYIQQLEDILELASTVTSTFSIEIIMENIVKRAVHLVDGADTGVLFLYEKDEDLLIPKFGWGLFWNELKHIRLKPGEALSGRAFVENQALLFSNKESIASVMEGLRSVNRTHYEKVFPSSFRDFQSTICAPLLWKGECLGVLAIHNVNSDVAFTLESLHLVKHIAVHAAIAFTNLRLYEEQRTYVKELDKSVQVHEKLTQMVLEEEGLERITSELAGLLNEPIYIFNISLELLAWGKPMDSFFKKDQVQLSSKEANKIKVAGRPTLVSIKTNEKEEFHMLASVVSVGHSVLGYIMVRTNHNVIDPQDQLILGRITTVIALEMMKKKVAYETEKQLKIDLFQEILDGVVTRQTSQKLNVLGYDPAKSYICLVVSYQEMEYKNVWMEKKDEIAESIHKLRSDTVTFIYRDLCVILFPVESNEIVNEKWYGYSEKDTLKLIQNLVGKVKQKYTFNLQVGVGSEFNELQGLPVSYWEALQAYHLMKQSKSTKNIYTYRSLGPLRFILQTADEKRLIKYVDEVLHPLISEDSEEKSKLLNTLIVYLESNRHVRNTAKALYIHHNTLSYRLQKIEGLLKIDLHDEADWLTVQLALRLWMMFNPNLSV